MLLSKLPLFNNSIISNIQLEGMAPDLLTGIGRLEIRPVQTERPHQIVSAPSTQPQSAPVKITQRLCNVKGREKQNAIYGW